MSCCVYSNVCDCHYMPAGAPEGLSLYESEQTLALLNEYLVKVGGPAQHALGADSQQPAVCAAMCHTMHDAGVVGSVTLKTLHAHRQ